MNIRIGENSSYDIDIELIESFVKYKNNLDNKNIAASIFEYYTSRLRAYWEKCKDNIIGLYHGEPSNINKKLYTRYRKKKNDNGLKRFLKLVNKAYLNLKEYEVKFFDLLNNMIDKFYKTYVIDENEVLDVTMFIVNVNCLRLDFTYDFNYFFKQYNKVKDQFNIFFIFNDTGFFYINSYLYSLFNGVAIFGVPSMYENNWDGNVGCSYDFIIHDSGHFAGIIISTDWTDNDSTLILKDKYYRILNSDYSRVEKECVSMGLFMALHENFVSVKNLIDYNRFKNIIIEENIR